MCDIWKGNAHPKQLKEKDIAALLVSLKKLRTKQVLLSGGEALLHPAFYELCRLLKLQGLHITLLSTGLTLQRHAAELPKYVDDLIVSLDGDEALHDEIRNIRGAYAKMKEGIRLIRTHYPSFPIRSRTVIHRLNYRAWPAIIQSARELGIDQVSFLPADVSSTAFNRDIPWNEERQYDLLIDQEALPQLAEITETLIAQHAADFTNHFIAESPNKLRQIHGYYGAMQGLNAFPYRKCNAPWVSSVIEPDGNVKPCFFHDTIGNIHEQPFRDIVNSDKAIQFRKQLNTTMNDTCMKCVCSLHLPPGINPAKTA